MKTPHTTRSADPHMDPARRQAMRALLVGHVKDTPAAPALHSVTSDQGMTRDVSVASERHAGSTASNPRRSTPRRRVLALSAAAAAAALVAGAMVGLPGVIGGSSSASAAAVEVLENAASKTRQFTDPVVGEDQYLKVQTEYMTSVDTDGLHDNVVVVQQHTTSTLYVPGDKGSEWISVVDPPTFTNAYGLSDEEFAHTLPEEEMSGSVERWLPQDSKHLWGRVQLPLDEYLADLPRDPDPLLERLRQDTAGQGKSPNGQLLVYMGDLLRTHQVPADLRAALLRSLALVNGVDVAEEETTLDGRSGVALSYTETSGLRSEIVLDPQTGELIGERQVVTEELGGIPAGTAYRWTTSRATVVDEAP